MRGNILVIEDEEYVFEDLEFGLGQAHNMHYADNLSKVNKYMRSYSIDLAFVDLNFQLNKKERLSGLKYIKSLRSRYPTLTIVVLSQYSDTDRIVKATQNGADYYLIKNNLDPDSDEFREQVRQWINTKKRLDQKRNLDSLEAWGKTEFSDAIMHKSYEYCLARKSFLLVGEPGLGKTFLLDQMYRKSPYFKDGKSPQEIDLAEIAPQDIKDFVHLRRGSGANNFLKKSPIKIIFLKNLDKISLSIQELFLTLIEKKAYIGTEEPMKLQLVFLVEKDPNELIQTQRLSPEFVAYMPKLVLKPLRDRMEDLPDLIKQWQRRKGRKDLTFTQNAHLLLRRYPYPGNITEFYALLNETLTNHQKKQPLDWQKAPIQPESLPGILHKTSSHMLDKMQFEVARVHLRFIEAALKKYEGMRGQKNLAAEELYVHSADNLKKTFINKYWDEYPDLMRGFPTIMKKYKLNG